jgi:hypothetical protein
VGRIGGYLPGISIKRIGGIGAKTITHNTTRIIIVGGFSKSYNLANLKSMIMDKFDDVVNLETMVSACFRIYNIPNICVNPSFLDFANRKTMVSSWVESYVNSYCQV